MIFSPDTDSIWPDSVIDLALHFGDAYGTFPPVVAPKVRSVEFFTSACEGFPDTFEFPNLKHLYVGYFVREIQKTKRRRIVEPDPAALASELGSIRENGDAISLIEIPYRNDSVFFDGDYPRSADDRLNPESRCRSQPFGTRTPLPVNSVCKLRHLIYRQHWIREGDLMTIGSQLKLCQSLETLCLPIEEKKIVIGLMILSFLF